MHRAGRRKRWRVAASADHEAVVALAQKLAVHPLAARLLIQRGVGDPDAARDFLNPTLHHLHDPATMPGIDRAADRLIEAVRGRQPIVIYGDYDVDGITASAILYHTLRMVDADVHTYVPHRIDEGYGLNCEAIGNIARGELPCSDLSIDGSASATTRTLGATPLIVSVDCGITAVEPARVARESGADLIITDHHEFDPAALPDAYALVHPRLAAWSVERGARSDSKSEPRAPHDKTRDTGHGTRDKTQETRDTTYPFPDLCGAGVAFKLAWHFARKWCGSERLPDDFKTLMIDLLSLAALGTIADVVPLVGENRVLAKFGLGRIKSTRFAGLNALIDAARLRDEKIDAYHVGFVLGPRLNACGRMGHAARAVHLLTRGAGEEAARIAEFLTHENDRRRATEKDIVRMAEQMVIESGYDADDRRAIVLGHADWHPGVLGIVASRLVERFARPVVMLNIHNGEAHGSARSVDGVSIHEALAHCAEHLRTFGGHAMAAGLRLDTERIDAFRESLIAFVNEQLDAESLCGTIDIDAECELSDLSVDLYQQLNALAPFGRDNPSPILCLRNVRVARQPLRVGGNGAHLKFQVTDGVRMFGAIAFGMGDLADTLAPGSRIDIAFEPHINEWNGRRSAELRVCDLCVAQAVLV